MNLRDCPFCGRDKPKLIDNSYPDGPKYYFVECPRCACRGPQSIHMKKALAGWNKRYMPKK